jgi:4-hydroxybenzoyl-CoA thioesterase
MMESNFSVRVYYEDTDAGGVVYYVNYLKFMERARTEMLRQKGLEQIKLARENILFVVHSASVRYVRPARLDDELVVLTQSNKTTKTSLIFMQRVMKEQTLLCEGEIKVACVAADSFKPCTIPKQLMMANK